MAYCFRSLNDYPREEKFRVLSLDAGGIYGSFTARVLEKMCRQDESFLAAGQITLFAGTSAGAIIALLLAKEENPRDAVLDGTLRSFFQDPLVYSNSLDMLQSILSLGLLTAWSGSKDFFAVLDKYFSNMKMGDLPHRVLIPTFDYIGDPDLPARERSWKPKIYYNFPDDEMDRETAVKDVAYGAASPAALRPIFRGISDGGVYAPEPSLCALAKIIEQMRRVSDQDKKALLAADISKAETAIADDLKAARENKSLKKKVSRKSKVTTGNDSGDTENKTYKQIPAEKILMLSMGVGNNMPFYWLNKINLGALPFNLIPTNPSTRDFFPPIFQLLLNSPTAAITYQCKQLLGGIPEHGIPDNYYRLNPQVIDFPVPPVIPAAGLARFAPFREFILRRISEDANLHYVDDDIDKTLQWLNLVGWQDGRSEQPQLC